MALHALAQCTMRLFLAHQQKQGRQLAGTSSRDSEEEGMHKDGSVYCTLADLGMEEQVKGGWYVCTCILRAFSDYRLIVLLLSCVLDHSGSEGCMVWSLTVLHGKLRTEPPRRHLSPPVTVQQKKPAKLLKRPLPKEVVDALFTYKGFFHGLGRMSLSA